MCLTLINMGIVCVHWSKRLGIKTLNVQCFINSQILYGCPCHVGRQTKFLGEFCQLTVTFLPPCVMYLLLLASCCIERDILEINLRDKSLLPSGTIANEMYTISHAYLPRHVFADSCWVSTQTTSTPSWPTLSIMSCPTLATPTTCPCWPQCSLIHPSRQHRWVHYEGHSRNSSVHLSPAVLTECGWWHNREDLALEFPIKKYAPIYQ